MKKCLLTIITCAAALPLFASNFDERILNIDADLKQEIAAQIVSSLEENSNYNKNFKQEPEHKIVTMIRNKMEFTLQNITPSTKFRKSRSLFNRIYVQEQQTQQQKYINMLEENVPSYIFNYIAGKFDLDKIQDVDVICRYQDETLIEVKFSYLGKFVVVSYDYDYADKPGQISPITHTII